MSVPAVEPPDLEQRRAIEALRAGLPSRAAVRVLGLAQPEIEDRFLALLDAAGTAATDRHPGGLLLGGGFGTGKSHTLEHLSALAHDRRFVVSKVVVSKETPLHDPVKLVRAAIEAAMPPGASGWLAPGVAVTEAIAELDVDSPEFATLLRSVSLGAAALDERFACTLQLLARVRGPGGSAVDDAAEAGIARFWAGDPLRTSDLRRWLRTAGEPRPTLGALPAKEQARQLLRFLPRLFRAAGWAGWVLLIDEVELVGRYSVTGRGKSYAEIAYLLSGPPEDPGLPMVPVLAMTDDYETAVLVGKNDREQVPTRLRAKQTIEGDELASAAVAGMRAIERQMVLLAPPDDRELDLAYQALRRLHGETYGWAPPEVNGLERLGATRMRQHVRAWINEWDLVRLDPAYTPASEVIDLASNFADDPDLERSDGADELGDDGQA